MTTLEELAKRLERHALWCYRESRGQDQLDCLAAAAACREASKCRGPGFDAREMREAKAATDAALAEIE